MFFVSMSHNTGNILHPLMLDKWYKYQLCPLRFQLVTLQNVEELTEAEYLCKAQYCKSFRDSGFSWSWLNLL